MARRQTRIFRNLHYRWTFAGLGMEDLAVIALPPSVLIAPITALGISLSWLVVLVVATAGVLIVIKRNRPPGYLESQVALHTTPPRFSHKERDREVGPFPLEPRELAPSRVSSVLSTKSRNRLS